MLEPFIVRCCRSLLFKVAESTESGLKIDFRIIFVSVSKFPLQKSKRLLFTGYFQKLKRLFGNLRVSNALSHLLPHRSFIHSISLHTVRTNLYQPTVQQYRSVSSQHSTFTPLHWTTIQNVNETRNYYPPWRNGYFTGASWLRGVRMQSINRLNAMSSTTVSLGIFFFLLLFFLNIIRLFTLPF